MTRGEARAAYMLAYKAKHKERLRVQNALYRETHREQRRQWKIDNAEKVRAYKRRPEVLEAERARKRKFYRENRDKFRRRDPLKRLIHSMRTRVASALKSAATSKSSPTLKLLGCTSKFLRSHIEALFRPGMTWENYGSYWQVDHKLPCASFDLSDPEQQKQCFHFSNLQPLTAEENRSKAAKLPEALHQPSCGLTSS